MQVTGYSLPAQLSACVEQQPDSPAYTFADGVHDGVGPAESLTWAQVYRRAQAVAGALQHCGVPGDRAAILAPQGLAHVAAFFGALHAGFIAVPLPVPQVGIHAERVSSVVRIVDPDSGAQCPEGVIGEIWLHGDNVALGYWRKPHQTEHTFHARLVNPSTGTPERPWLRTEDLGVFSGGELFIMGRLKDFVIVDGQNHFPDDIEGTVQEITGGRVAAVAIPQAQTEQLVVIAEVKQRPVSSEEAETTFRGVKRDVTSVVSAAHGLRIADLVVVEPGSIPITSSGKVRRSACVDHYLNGRFARTDVTT